MSPLYEEEGRISAFNYTLFRIFVQKDENVKIPDLVNRGNIPLAGIIFIAITRYPIIGMAAAFAGVSSGFSADLILWTIDPLLGLPLDPGAGIYYTLPG